MNQKTRQRHAASKARKAKNRKRSATEIEVGRQHDREAWKPKHHLAMSHNQMDIAWMAAMGLTAIILKERS